MSKWKDFINARGVTNQIIALTKEIIKGAFKDNYVDSNGFGDLVDKELRFGIAPNLELLYEDAQAMDLLKRILYQELPQVYIQWKQFTSGNRFDLAKITTSNATMSDGYGGLSLTNQDGQYKIDKANTNTTTTSNLEIFEKMKKIEANIFKPLFKRIESELLVLVWAV